MFKILVVDDEAKIREFIRFFLSKEGYAVRDVETGEKALDIIKNDTIDLVLLDLMMPGLNGFETCTLIREKSNVPVIMLTAVEGEADHVEGYAVGVDDYITKPFKVKILIAKINRILGKNTSAYTQYLELKINELSRDVLILDEPVVLTPKEYELLHYLLQNNKIALSRDQILNRVWGADFDGGTRVVDNHIKKLRSKLSVFGDHIKTVVGLGYKLEV